MEQWQYKILNKIRGMKTGEITTVSYGGRGSGKSQMLSVYLEYFEKLMQDQRMQNHTRQRLLAEGWLPVECGDHFMKNWTECHAICKETFGDNYTWTGEIFWFRTESDILWFKMAFGT
jgi:hypothetical protein